MAADLVIRISGEIDDFEKALDDAKDQTQGLSDTLTAISAAAAVAFAALTTEAYASVSAFAQSQEASNRLVASLQQQGIYSKELESRYKATADALEKKTGSDGDAITSGIALAQNMLGQVEISDQLIRATVDLAAAKKMDLVQAFDLVSKAVAGNTGALAKYGIQVTDAGDRVKNMANVAKALELAFGGQAEAGMKGLGVMKALGVVYDDIQKGIGEKLAPVVERLVGGLVDIGKSIAANENLLAFAAACIAGGIALSGLVTIVGAAGVALTGLTAITAAFGTTLTVALGPIGLATAGIVALAAAFGAMAIKSSNIVSPVDELSEALKRAHEQMTSLKDNKWLQASDNAEYRRLVAEQGAIISDLEERMRRLNSAGNKKSPQQEAEDERKAAAARAEAERKAQEERERAATAIHLKVLKDQALGASQEMIKLEQEEANLSIAIADQKNAAIRGALQSRLTEVRDQLAAQSTLELQEQAMLNEQLLASNAEFQSLTAIQKQQFLDANNDTLRASVMTEVEMRKQAALDSVNAQIATNNTYLQNQQKFGTAYALINKLMHSEIYTGTKTAFENLAALQQSSNSTLKAIGKAAAIANITMQTAQAAMNIYAGFATIPIVGPALGVVGAAAAVAFGAEQISRVTAAADGGLITGGVAGRDSVPAMLMPGELVVPTRNFDEVVSAAAAARTGQSPASGDGQIVTVVLQLKDELMNFIDAKLIERSQLGIGVRVSA